MERARTKKQGAADHIQYEALRDLHYALMREYVNIIKAAEGLHFFAKLPGVREHDRHQLGELVEATVPGGFLSPLRRAWKIALRAEAMPIKLPLQRGPASAEREALSDKERSGRKARTDVQALPKRMVDGTKDAAENVAACVVKPYFSIARFLVLGPLVRRYVRVHIRARLTKLRSLYIAERSATPAFTDVGEANREILSDLIEGTSDFLQRNEDISKLSRGRAEVRGAIGGLVSLGLPGGVVLAIANWLSKIDAVKQAFFDIMTGNVDWSRLNVGLATGGIAGVIVTLLFLGLIIWTQVMAFYTKKSLLSGGAPAVFGRRMEQGFGANAYELEDGVFRALGVSPPREVRSDIWYCILSAAGLLLGILGFLAMGQT